MTVYVDEFRVWAPSAIPCFRHGSCHLTADTTEELHEMADKIGLKRSWFQDGRHPHYDLAKSRRTRAIRAGAVYMPAREQFRKGVGMGRHRRFFNPGLGESTTHTEGSPPTTSNVEKKE